MDAVLISGATWLILAFIVAGVVGDARKEDRPAPADRDTIRAQREEATAAARQARADRWAEVKATQRAKHEAADVERAARRAAHPGGPAAAFRRGWDQGGKPTS